MNDPVLVRVLNRTSDRCPDHSGKTRRKGRPADALGKRWSFDELQRDERFLAAIAHAVDLDDIWMVKPRDGLRFLQTPPNRIVIGKRTVSNPFDGHRSIEVALRAR